VSNVGTVTFDVAAETAKLRAELDKVKKDVGGLSASAKKFEQGLKTVGGVIATVFSVGAVSAFFSKVNQAGDRLNDLSQRLGVSASRLNILELAATQAGASTESVATAMAKLTENVGSAAMGNKEASNAISALGLSTAELLKLRPDQAFEAVNEALSRMPNEFQRAAVAQDLFGKGAKELAAFYREGKTAIDEATETLERHNAVLSDLDVARIGVMNDQFAAQDKVITNLGMKFLSHFSPAMSVALESVSQLTQSVGGTAEAGRTMGIVFVGAIKAIETAVNLIQAAFETVRSIVATVIGAVMSGLEKLVGGFAWVAEKLGLDVAESLRATQEGISGIAESMFAIGESAGINAKRAGSAALQAGMDILRSAELFDEAATRMEKRAAAAAARIPGGGAIASAEASRFGEKGRGRQDEPIGGTGSVSAGVRIEDPTEFARVMKEIDFGLVDSLRKAGIGRVEAWRTSLEQITGLSQLAADQQIAIEQAKVGNIASLMGMTVGAAFEATGKLGKVQKALAIAGTIWSTGHAIMRAMSQVPWPASLAAAASIAAMGAREIQRIKGTNFSVSGSVSGGGGAGFSGGGAGADERFTTPAAVEQQQPQRSAQIIVNGNIFSSQETADWMLGVIRDAVEGRDVTIISANSRQALELRSG